MKISLNTVLLTAVILGFTLFNSLFVVHEGERALVTRFAKVLRDSSSQVIVYEPGPHFKWPFVDKVKLLDARIQTLNSNEDRFVTVEKKDLIIDSYVKWQIEDFVKYYLSTKGDRFQAESLLRTKITNSLRSQIGLLTIKEIVSGKSEAGDSDDTQDSKRDQVMQNALQATSVSARDLGIRIIDVRMMKINLPKEVSDSIYQRMRAERDAVARLHRSQGRQEAEAIRANADRQSVVKLAEAEKQAKTIKAQGEAEATQIYADSYSRNTELFDFLRSMDAYRKSMGNGGNIIVTDEDNEFFKHMK
ncbi:protease modulator HflC [Succinimonas sp.]|uniref:protease modulator HflC n=1 Tax=Succinimonas sp. TaxID=1936151 RepID=UPI00386708CC|nr:protease modulator HflC [Succinimonas sp.]